LTQRIESAIASARLSRDARRKLDVKTEQQAVADPKVVNVVRVDGRQVNLPAFLES
jgi:hypothetical protein